MGKPRTASGYSGTALTAVHDTCLYLATILGDLIAGWVVVGGLVPSLLVDQARGSVEPHVGTMDLDLGLSVALLDSRRYEVLTERLRGAGFEPDVNPRGIRTRQRWRIEGPPKVTVDFLIPASGAGDVGGQLRDIEGDFAAIIAPGLRLAFLDRVSVVLDGNTIRGERARRDVGVCGPGAFVLMKALALRDRGEPKDAYDLVYLLRNFGTGPRDVAAAIARLTGEDEAQKALACLRDDFATVDSVGPKRAAAFLESGSSEEGQADACGAVRSLLGALP